MRQKLLLIFVSIIISFTMPKTIMAQTSNAQTSEESLVEVMVIKQKIYFEDWPEIEKAPDYILTYIHKNFVKIAYDSSSITFLYNARSDELINIDDEEKSYGIINKNNENPSSTTIAVKIKEFKGTVKIKDWVCKKFEITYIYGKNNRNTHLTYITHIATDFKIPDALYKYQLKNAKYFADNATSVIKLEKSFGLEVKNVLDYYSRQGKPKNRVIVELDKIYKTKVDKSIFEIPKGYKEVKRTLFN